MKQDVTALLEVVASRKRKWTESKFRGALKSIGDLVPEVTIDWDEGAGEDWGSALVEKKRIASVCRVAPLAMVAEKYQDKLKPRLSQIGAEVLVTPAYDGHVFSAGSAALEKVFPNRARMFYPDDPAPIDWHNFSANDLWWATI